MVPGAQADGELDGADRLQARRGITEIVQKSDREVENGGGQRLSGNWSGGLLDDEQAGDPRRPATQRGPMGSVSPGRLGLGLIRPALESACARTQPLRIGDPTTVRA